jgi:hypothetical protein
MCYTPASHAMDPHHRNKGSEESCLLTAELLARCSFSTTKERLEPKTLSQGSPALFDYYKRNVKINLPGRVPRSTFLLSSVVLHHNAFIRFGRVYAYIGVPQAIERGIAIAMINSGTRPLFKRDGLGSEDTYWWTCHGFPPAAIGKERAFVVNTHGGEVCKIPFTSLEDLFVYTASSVAADVTCSMEMTAEVPVSRNGLITDDDEWQLNLSISKIIVTDFISMDKPEDCSELTRELEKGRSILEQPEPVFRGREMEDMEYGYGPLGEMTLSEFTGSGYDPECN